MKIQTVKTRIAADLAAYEARIAALIAEGMTEQESRAAADHLMHCIESGNLSGFTPAHARNLELADLLDMVSAYRETLAADLFHCPARYVITREGETLVKPAGVKPEDRVFRKTEVMINTNRLPYRGVGLRYFDLEA